MKAVLVSFFDSNNIGDLLISDSLFTKVSNYFDEVTKINYLDGEVVPEKDSLEIESSKTKKEVRTKSTKETVAEVLANVKLTSLNYLYLKKIKNYQLNKFEEKIKNSDVLIIGGGNMIFDIYERTLVAARFNEYVEIAKKYNKKIFAMSLGIGPFQTDYQEKLAVESLSKCDYVTFRDQKSFEIYKKRQSDHAKNVSVSVDPVFTLPNLVKNVDADNSIGINIINNPEYSGNPDIYRKVVNGYVLLINNLRSKTNKKIKLFSTETRDYEVIHDVYNSLNQPNNIEIVYIESFNKLIELYSEFSLLIGTRMHSMIIAYTQMVPVVGLSWQPKVQAMFDIINEPKNCFNLTEVERTFEKITEVSMEKIKNENNIKNEMQKQLKLIQQKEEINEENLRILSEK